MSNQQTLFQGSSNSTAKKTTKKSDIFSLLKKGAADGKFLYIKEDGNTTYISIGNRAPSYAKKHSQESGKKVYFITNPPIGGSAVNIVNAAQEAGFGDFIGKLGEEERHNLTVPNVEKFAYDFSNKDVESAYKKYITSIIGKPSTGKKGARTKYLDFSKYLEIFESSSGTKAKGVKKSSKTKAKDVKEWVVKVNQMFKAISEGSKYTSNGKEIALNVSDYDPQTNTHVRTARYTDVDKTLIYPLLPVDNQLIRIPLVFNTQGYDNFVQFVKNVVGNSAYSGEVDNLIQAGEKALSGASNKPRSPVNQVLLPNRANLSPRLRSASPIRQINVLPIKNPSPVRVRSPLPATSPVKINLTTKASPITMFRPTGGAIRPIGTPAVSPTPGLISPSSSLSPRALSPRSQKAEPLSPTPNVSD